MRIVMTGAAGMVGRKLTARLLADGVLRGQAITDLHLYDVVASDAVSANGIDVHVLPDAGHWVHVDDPAGLQALLDVTLSRR